MVVDHVQDLDVTPVGQADVGGVHLPALVGELGDKADVGAPGPLVGLGGDEAPGPKHTPDRRDRRDLAVALGEVLVDRLRASVPPGVLEGLAKPHDLVFEQVGDPRRRAVRTFGAGDEPGLAFGFVAGEELVEPAPVHAVGGRQLGDRRSLFQVALDEETTLVHRRPPFVDVSDVLTHQPLRCRLCPEIAHPLAHDVMHREAGTGRGRPHRWPAAEDERDPAPAGDVAHPE